MVLYAETTKFFVPLQIVPVRGTVRKMSLNYALDILMYSCRFCS